MAKKRKRKYSRGSSEEVKREMHRYKRGKAKSGKGGRGGRVKSRKQAIAIARKGRKFPERRAERRAGSDRLCRYTLYPRIERSPFEALGGLAGSSSRKSMC
jgi:hypothetical protein